MNERRAAFDWDSPDNDENVPPGTLQHLVNPEEIDSLRPVLFALAALSFHLFLPGTFIFLDEDDDIVSTLIYCEDSQHYLCVVYQTDRQSTHYQHFPAQQALQNG